PLWLSLRFCVNDRMLAICVLCSGSFQNRRRLPKRYQATRTPKARQFDLCTDFTSFDSSPDHIQRRINRQRAYELTVAGKDKFARRGLRIIREGNVNQPDRFLLAASARPRDARDAYAESRTGAFANARGHRFGHLLAYGAMFFDPFLRHAQQI